MSQHSDRLQAAEREVIDCAVSCEGPHRPPGPVNYYRRRIHVAVRNLLALRALTCPECGGSGIGKPIEYRDASTQRLLHRSPNGCPACSGTGVKP